jgi:hypothetical protein
MRRNYTREQRRQLERDNLRWPPTLMDIPRELWADKMMQGSSAMPVRVLRSREFLVQVFEEPAPVRCRLSICRTAVQAGEWLEGITWDELQRIKRECGYGLAEAVEIFPRDLDIVNVANMRHLWVMRDPIPFAWRDKERGEP